MSSLDTSGRMVAASCGGRSTSTGDAAEEERRARGRCSVGAEGQNCGQQITGKPIDLFCSVRLCSIFNGSEVATAAAGVRVLGGSVRNLA